MSLHHARYLIFFLVFCAPLLMGSNCHKAPVEGGGTAQTDNVTPPEVELQVVSIDPASAAVDTPFQAHVYGSAFRVGARLLLGSVETPDIDVVDANTIVASVPALPSGIYDVTVTNPDGQRGVLRRGLTIGTPTRSCAHVTIWFDFDSSEIRADALGTLRDQATCLGQSRGTIRVEGHCDARGTTDYNIALGQRRAAAVQRNLVGQGISPSRVDTISYGEERPLVQGSGEDVWARNRRAEILLED
jgi:peptidoglycan-associated lipoprotein